MKVLNALEGFRRRVARPQLPQGGRAARVIAVAAQKGGVGKTTTTVNLAAALARFHGLKTLLLDMDPQGHVGMSLRGLSHTPTRSGEPGGSQDTPSLGALLLQKRRDVFEIAAPTLREHLWLVPSDCSLNETEAIMASRIGKELLLRKALQTARTHFDVVLIDCPPTLGALTINALVAASDVLIPCDLSALSLDGVEALLETLEEVRETLNPNLSLLGLLRTRVDRRNQTLNQTIERSLEHRYARWLLQSVIGVSTDLAKSQLEGQPIFDYQNRSRAAAFYRSLSDEIAARLK